MNTNTNNNNLRQSMIVTDVNSEVATVMTSVVTDSISGNEKFALFGGVNADNLKVCSTDPNNPEMVIYSPAAM